MYLLPTHSLGCESYSRSRPSGWLNLKLEPGPCSERHQRAVALPAWDTQDEIGPWARQNRSSGWRGRQTQPSTQTCDHRPDGSAQAVHFHPPDGTSRVCCKTRASQALFPEGKTGGTASAVSPHPLLSGRHVAQAGLCVPGSWPPAPGSASAHSSTVDTKFHFSLVSSDCICSLVNLSRLVL